MNDYAAGCVDEDEDEDVHGGGDDGMMTMKMVAINGDEDNGDEDGGNEQMKKTTTDNCCEDNVDTYAYPKLFYNLEPLVLHSLFLPQDIARPRSAVPD